MKLNVRNIKLKDELGNFVALIKQQLEELTSLAMASKGKVNKDVISGMVSLTKCFEAATRSKINLDKAEKKKEDSMTPEEELEAVKKYLLEDFDHRDRLDIINELIVEHNKRCMSARKPFCVREVDNGK